jgi:hypothetical protein
LALIPVLGIAALAAGIVVIVTLLSSAPPVVVYFALVVESMLAVSVSLLRKEASKRAGSRVGVDVWRASDAWESAEFTLNHDYDPAGADFAELVRIAQTHGYALESDRRVSHASTWRFARAVA